MTSMHDWFTQYGCTISAQVLLKYTYFNTPPEPHAVTCLEFFVAPASLTAFS